MDRRRFFSRVGGGIAAAGLAKAGLTFTGFSRSSGRKAVFDVKGFTCVTCATGLEVILLREKGVTNVVATYPESKVTVSFDEALTSDEVLREIIAGCGFTVA